MVSEGESMTIMAGSRAAGRRGAGAAAESLYVIPKMEVEEGLDPEHFETSKPSDVQGHAS